MKYSFIFILLMLLINHNGISQEIISGWQVFNTSNSAIPDNHICDVKIDDKDVMWVATWSGGLARFKDLRWKTYNTSTSNISSNSINQVALDKKNQVWIATNGGGIAHFTGATWKSIELPGENTALCIAVSKKGDKLIGTPKHGLYLYDKTGSLTKLWGVQERLENRVHHISFDNSGHALVSTAQGLLKFTKTVRDGYSTSFKVVRKAHTLQSVMDRKGRIVAIDFDSGHLMTLKNNRWEEEKNPNENVMVALNGSHYDYAGNAMTLYKSGRVAVGTRYFGGLVIREDKDDFWTPILPPFASYNLQGGIKCVAEGDKQSIWVGTYKQGLMIPIDEEPELDSAVVNHQTGVEDLEKARKLLQRRREILKDTVKIEGGEVDLMVWDAQTPDGDVITLIFNGKILLDKYEVTKTPARLRLTIEPNKPNKLVMYAHNTGKVPPNTAMLSIIHTDQEKEIELTSDLINAESLIIIQDIMKVVKKRGKKEATENEAIQDN